MRRLLRGTGWSFIGMGTFVLYFLVYQLVATPPRRPAWSYTVG